MLTGLGRDLCMAGTRVLASLPPFSCLTMDEKRETNMSVVQSPSRQLQGLIEELDYTQAAMYNTTTPTLCFITASSQ